MRILGRVATVVIFGSWCAASGQTSGHAAGVATAKMAATVMQAWPAGRVETTKSPGSWGYEEGVLLDGLAADWQQNGNSDEFTYIQSAVDKYVQADGTIRMNASGKLYASDEHQLDNVELGRAVLLVYRATHQPRYAAAARFLHDELEKQPRTASGGYWHKQIYPNQIWLDGAYMAEPFRAAYAKTFRLPREFDDIAKQLLLMDEHMRDARTGLLKHGWDESKTMAWADPASGLSPEVWARAMGWYCMALVDVLDWFPAEHPQRAALVRVLRRNVRNVAAAQETASGLWWQVMTQPGRAGNFLEASASSMFVYAMAKGVRKGYLAPSYGTNARRGWEGIERRFVTSDASGRVTLTGTVKAAGLGGRPYRSGTYDYYVAEPTGDNDAKGVGAYLLAGSEMEQVGRRIRRGR